MSIATLKTFSQSSGFVYLIKFKYSSHRINFAWQIDVLPSERTTPSKFLQIVGLKLNLLLKIF